MEKLSSGVHPFEHVRRFMLAGGHSIDNSNDKQNDLYIELIKEELQELWDGIGHNDNIETIDAICDLTWVLVGYAHSRGWDIMGAFNEVARSNMSKVDAKSGKLIKRADGKVLKPETYSPPNLTPFVK